MRDGEEKIDDTRGRYLRTDSSARPDAERSWSDARFVITSQRLLVFDVTGDKTSIPLADVRAIESCPDLSTGRAGADTQVEEATRLDLGDEQLFVSTGLRIAFETYLHQAGLNGQRALIARAPDDGETVDWLDGRLFVSTRRLQLVATDGHERTIDPGDVRTVDTSTDRVREQRRTVTRIEYDGDGGETETWVTVDDAAQPFLMHFLAEA